MHTSVNSCSGPSRRSLLQVGALGVLGLSLPDLWRVRAFGKTSQRSPKKCIILYLSGGPSQHDTWDPKPDAPAEIRGPFRPIASSTPGLRVCELMPCVARMAHRCCVLKAVTTGDHSHASSIYQVLTGYRHQPTNTETVRAGAPNDQPHFGSALRQLYERTEPRSLPSFITLPEYMSGNDFQVPPGQFAGRLGRRFDPWVLTCDPSAPAFQLPALELPDDVSPDRLIERRSLLRRLDGAIANTDHIGKEYQRHTARAFELLRTATAGRAFDLNREPAAIRDRYGRHKAGQSILLARRLSEAGIPLIQVNWPRYPNDRRTNNPIWDTHSDHNARMKDVLMPQMDQSYSALLEDLEARGMLDDTLVVWMGEFGRTPKLNSRGGRDHWGGVFSVVLAGAGVRGGTVLGASDRIGAFPRDGAVTPRDVTATICHALGFDPATEIFDVENRPHPLSRGQLIRGVLDG